MRICGLGEFSQYKLPDYYYLKRLGFFQRVWGSFYKNALYKFTVITIFSA